MYCSTSLEISLALISLLLEELNFGVPSRAHTTTKYVKVGLLVSRVGMTASPFNMFRIASVDIAGAA